VQGSIYKVQRTRLKVQVKGFSRFTVNLQGLHRQPSIADLVVWPCLVTSFVFMGLKRSEGAAVSAPEAAHCASPTRCGVAAVVGGCGAF
jgi:hypothetical protein